VRGQIQKPLRFRPVLLMAVLICAGCADFALLPDNQEFIRAENLYREGNFERALGLYSSLETRPSQEFRRDTILFQKGECLIGLNAPAEATLAFQTIYEHYPQSEYKMDAGKRLADLQRKGGERMTRAERMKAQATERLEAARKTLTGGILNSRETVPYLLQAADALWILERYEEARDVYVEALNLEPSLRENSSVRGRLLLPSDSAAASGGGILGWLRGTETAAAPLDPSKVLPLTPQASVVWPDGRKPLIAYNTTLRWRRYKEDQRARLAIVTGNVKNQSSGKVGPARVEVTLLNTRMQILDVAYADVAALAPSATAAFRVQMGPFDDYENVTDYEVRVLLNSAEVDRR